MTTPAICPRCGSPLPADAPQGLCPKCLLQAGFETGSLAQPQGEATASSPAGTGFEPPTVEELAKRFPQLEILELLGKGGMGAVYKARQPGLDRLVAVKILPPEVGRDPSFAERFAREARALARLSHPNIVSVYDFGQADGLYYFVMEYIDGANLRQTIQAGTLRPEEALAIVPQICDALQYAHDEGVVHRDIKPENILIDRRGRVKIADFGLAKLLGDDLPEVSLTGTHQVMGTIRYMAPEQMQGTKAVDHRADIYSLGVVFYELLTGDVPMGRFAPPSKKVQIDVRLDEVVLKALEREPEQRYQHASDLKTEIEAVHGSTPKAPGAASPTAAPTGRALARRTMISTLVIVSLAQTPFLALTWGYLSGSQWYFQKEVPYGALVGWWIGLSAAAVGSLVRAWYLLAKDPGVARSFNDFLHVWQTSDPRLKKVTIPMFVFIVLWLAATLIALTITSNDAVHTIIFSSAFLVGPYILMATIWNAYGAGCGTATAAAFGHERARRSQHPGDLKGDGPSISGTDHVAGMPPGGQEARIDGFAEGGFTTISQKALAGLSLHVVAGIVAAFSTTVRASLGEVGVAILLTVAGGLAVFGLLFGVLGLLDIRASRGRLTGVCLAFFDAAAPVAILAISLAVGISYIGMLGRLLGLLLLVIAALLLQSAWRVTCRLVGGNGSNRSSRLGGGQRAEPQPETSGDPGAAATGQPPGTGRLSPSKRQRLLAASIGLLLVGGWLMVEGFSELRPLLQERPADELAFPLRTTLGVAVMAAAVLMMTLRLYGFAVVGSVLAIVASLVAPFSPYWVAAALGTGLWCILTLRDEEIRKAFKVL
jgi:predicted Ser/Thr protein kinase